MTTKADKIKLVAQFLFDNADEIVEELDKSDNYRCLHIDIDRFKHEDNIDTTAKVYDSTSGHQYMTKNRITLDELRIACREMNVQAGLIVVADDSVVREELAKPKEK